MNRREHGRKPEVRRAIYGANEFNFNVNECVMCSVAGGRAARTEKRQKCRRRKSEMRRKRGAGGDAGRRLGHLTHINERLLSAFCVAMREQFVAGKFAPQSFTTWSPVERTGRRHARCLSARARRDGASARVSTSGDKRDRLDRMSVNRACVLNLVLKSTLGR
jgi:hypothetical protein